MIFKLGTTNFEIDEDKSRFYIDREDDMIQFSLDIAAKKQEYRNGQRTPALNINWFETEKKDTNELIGIEVSVSTINEADEREDTFYLYEHEPFVKYQLKIIDIHEKRIHVCLKGVVVEEGYVKPYTTETLEIDCWLRTK